MFLCYKCTLQNTLLTHDSHSWLYFVWSWHKWFIYYSSCHPLKYLVSLSLTELNSFHFVISFYKPGRRFLWLFGLNQTVQCRAFQNRCSTSQVCSHNHSSFAAARCFYDHYLDLVMANLKFFTCIRSLPDCPCLHTHLCSFVLHWIFNTTIQAMSG